MYNKYFEEDYRNYKAIEAEYRAAEDEDGKEVARAKVRKLYAEIQEKGKVYCELYELYKEAQEKGNEYIDLHKNIWDEDVKGLVEGFRKYGIESFTLSSTWTSAVSTAWLFSKHGCTVEGMVELNGDEKLTFGSTEKEYDAVHGYIFKVN